MYVCARIENDPVEEPEEFAGEAPEQQSFGGGKCPLTYLCPIHSLIHLPHYTFIPKDWLAFVIHVLVYLFGSDYYYLVWCYCSTLINEHDVIPSLARACKTLIHSRGEWPGIHYEAFTKIPRDCSHPLGFLNAPHSSPRGEPKLGRASRIHRAPLTARRLSELHPGSSNYSAKGTPFHPHGCTVFPGGHP